MDFRRGMAVLAFALSPTVLLAQEQTVDFTGVDQFWTIVDRL
ncbi:MAG: hypothetical protein PVF05_01640 [Gemmatimonadales bacterium]|jgi:hypothetical protein